MILCDTNIFIEFYKNTPDILQELHYMGYQHIALSAITQGELYVGARNKAEFHKIKRHLALLHHFPLTKTITQKFLDLMETYCLSHALSLPDSLIAATALVHDVELYTLNTKDFQYIDNLRLYQPVTHL
ncbi:PIN domain-containing protein [candidate division KSB3 bacterium]|uniref:PIN domain-containing protein n=1 Tax=candidate division KSB3 bacterium TaxID=2044937 RepID=A0A9D5Q677_9BACT|nr:PIN domain-containing protein [candidate division KSB3 bacterium]MBD3325559.1 PIN domain-containing protein [candidate division KSB3 bacterium]